jgi:hypothetical protein
MLDYENPREFHEQSAEVYAKLPQTTERRGLLATPKSPEGGSHPTFFLASFL